MARPDGESGLRLRKLYVVGVAGGGGAALLLCVVLLLLPEARPPRAPAADAPRPLESVLPRPEATPAEPPPPLVRAGTPAGSRSTGTAEEARKRKEAGERARAQDLWTGIEAKARSHEKGDPLLAIAILESVENLPDDLEDRLPEIREKRRKWIEDLRTGMARLAVAAAEDDRKRRLEADRLRRIADDERRERLWMERLAGTKPVHLIARAGDDLDGWPLRYEVTGPRLDDIKLHWTIHASGGVPIIAGDATGCEYGIELGVNGNRWLDWVLEFEVKVEAGTLRLGTRTVIEGDVPFVEVVRTAEREFELPAQRFGDWKRVRVEARVKQVTLTVKGGARETREQIEARDHTDGGFVFALAPGGKAQIRGAQLWLLSDDQRPREEAEE